MNFLKGVTPWFLSKNRDFLLFSFYAKWMKKKCFFEGSENKEAFLEQNNIVSKNHQKFCIFSKGLVFFFLSKNGDILIFRCYPKRDQEIVFCEGFVGKEAFLDHKNIDSKTTKT